MGFLTGLSQIGIFLVCKVLCVDEGVRCRRVVEGLVYTCFMRGRCRAGVAVGGGYIIVRVDLGFGLVICYSSAVSMVH